MLSLSKMEKKLFKKIWRDFISNSQCQIIRTIIKGSNYITATVFVESTELWCWDRVRPPVDKCAITRCLRSVLRSFDTSQFLRPLFLIHNEKMQNEELVESVSFMIQAISAENHARTRDRVLWLAQPADHRRPYTPRSVGRSRSGWEVIVWEGKERFSGEEGYW